MSKVPDRFLGFAFTVGDVLLEVDTKLNVLNADGAISILASEDDSVVMGKPLSALVSEQDMSMFDLTMAGLDKASRIGPIMISCGLDPDNRKEFAMFAGRLPMYADITYLALSYPYRLGLDEDEEDELTDNERKDKFFNRLDKLLQKTAGTEENLMVTVLESDINELTSGKQKEVEKFLKSFSVGGNSAAKLTESKFALVHEKGESGESDKLISDNLSKATGVNLNSASIDASKISEEGDEDGMKALVFSLQQFAEDNQNFDMQTFKSEGSDLIQETTTKVTKFRDMLNAGDFNFVYQPIVSLQSGTTHHFEALCRFDLKGVNVNQFEMICFAEDVGLIMDFDHAILKRAIGLIKPKMGMASAPKIAVNLSGKSLSNAAFLDNLVEELKNAPSLARNLSLEVTESAKITDLEGLNKVLEKIRALGFRVYLDDFGAGASGFQYLKQLVVDGVKIDGEYVRDAVKDKTTRAFLMSMATLCQQIGVETVAEWVETKEHADLLTKIGVNYGQGYYYGKPSPNLTPARARAAG
ncbi:EAL domain-containing protein [Temperatibacter marinus]|uniref:EAL domain-containing protein n=1 Tax=Temperatibacter marinus TaxID=1456591 RepID=A0AA52EI58_9PROT|nr:EAL domain-containing protein [Temperatibacter marinus]WND02486.1 EAL domain-containing protein [Temperatibacter marinus]